LRIGDHPSLRAISARTFLPVSSGLFVLPNAGPKPSQLLASSRHVAQVSSIERVQAKADLHDKLFAAREGIATVAAGEIGDRAIEGAATAFNAYLDALDRGNPNDRRKGEEIRVAMQGLRPQAAAGGVDVVGGKLAPDLDAVAGLRANAPETVSEAFVGLRDRLDPLFAAHSESIAVEAETAQARVPVAQHSASIGATIAGLTLRGAALTQILTRMTSANRKQLTQTQKIQKLAAAALPRPTVPGTVLPGFPALGKPVGIAGPDYEVNRRTPGIAPAQPTVSEARSDGIPAFEPPRPVEPERSRKADAPPGQRAEITEAVRDFERKSEGRPLGAKIRLPETVEGRRVDGAGRVRPAKPQIRQQPRPPERVPGPPPDDRKPRKGVPEVAPPTQESEPVTPRDEVPKNPGKPLKDLLPPRPLPPQGGNPGGGANPGNQGNPGNAGNAGNQGNAGNPGNARNAGNSGNAGNAANNGGGNGNNAGGFDMPAPPQN